MAKKALEANAEEPAHEEPEIHADKPEGVHKHAKVHTKTHESAEAHRPSERPHKSREGSKTPWIIGITILVVILVAAGIWYSVGRTKTSGAVLATVNGDPIYKKEVDDLYSRLPEQYKGLITEDQLLNQTIARQLLLQEAKRQNIVVSDAEVNTVIDALLTQSQMTREQLTQQLALRNLTINDMVSEYKMQIAVNRLLNQTVYKTITISDDEARVFYNANPQLFEQVRASHILVNSSEQAQKILDMIKKGADFADMAKTYSLDKGSAANGGDLDYFTRSQMVKEFSDAAFNMTVGQVSGVVQTQYGYHLIKVTAKRAQPFDDVKDKIKQALATQRQSTAAQAYINRLWGEAKITYS